MPARLTPAAAFSYRTSSSAYGKGGCGSWGRGSQLPDLVAQGRLSRAEHAVLRCIAERDELCKREGFQVIASARRLQDVERLRRARALSKELGGCTAVQVALAWLLHNPVVTAPIIGPRTLEQLESAVRAVCDDARDYSVVTNGRFKGGWTTRHYGEPGRGLHAIQMELAQGNYMREQAPWHYDADRAGRLRVILAAILHNLIRTFD